MSAVSGRSARIIGVLYTQYSPGMLASDEFRFAATSVVDSVHSWRADTKTDLQPSEPQTAGGGL